MDRYTHFLTFKLNHLLQLISDLDQILSETSRSMLLIHLPLKEHFTAVLSIDFEHV